MSNPLIDQKEVQALETLWRSERFKGVIRSFSAEKVLELRGSMKIEYTVATEMANKLWGYVNEPGNGYVNALGALTGNQAIQMVEAGLRGIYLSGWQVAGDNNLNLTMYPDQSLYPSNSVPQVVQRINNALMRRDQVQSLSGKKRVDYWQPIVADAEAGFGGPLNAYELMLQMIQAGAAGVHFEDQLASAKKCGHLGGKVLVPSREFITKLNAARLAADVAGVPSIIVARTDADAAGLLTSDIDERDRPFCTGERTEEGFFVTKPGIDQAIARGLNYAPYADLVWCETSTPDMAAAKKFAAAIHAEFPGKLLAYNCSPSFNWKAKLSDEEIARFQNELGAMGYKFQFITLAGFHNLNIGMWDLANAYRERQMSGFVEMQQREFSAEERGFAAVKHQAFVGTGFFDAITNAVTEGKSSVTAMEGSTEAAQFH
ncbi:MAG: isocitrate lyase [Candidatus Hydrogenedentes bacterium]|nr:isocitrate lyase [Candidatus Hydrogenedentota bacterium]